MFTTPRLRLGALALSAASAIGLVTVAASAPAGAQTAPATTTAAKKGPTINIGDTRLGKILVDGEGLSLYMFSPDRRNVATCDGQCLVVWPPVVLTGTQTLADVTTGPGLRRSQLGIAVRPDGVRQVTYNSWPLYYWYLDTKPGDVRGQWVNNIWFVLSDDGFPIGAR
jgi:predicted lipoprotein with Yx(FWY)xxD motif